MKYQLQMFKSKEEKFDNSKSNKKDTSTTPQEKKTISSLAPKVLKGESKKKVQPYLDKLKDAIDEEGINNIAIMGNYGSGKSTIIKTFQHYNSQYEYLNISLASFSEPKGIKQSNECGDENHNFKEELDRLLEVSILQQIFYYVKSVEIPKSRFKRIIELPTKMLIGKGVLFVIWLICTVLTIKYNYLNSINPITWNANESFDFSAFFILLITFIGLGYGFVCVIEVLRNAKITKVNIKGELELGEEVNKSILNEHLDEIFYFFEKTNFKVVVIEDLDRFRSTDIFTKLREINILLNNSKAIEGEIKFIYAVGDFLFLDKKERVKFFEYIIPIIPFINSSNAEGQLKDLMRESKLEEDIFSQNFISDVVAFIDDIDMRLLLNIFHEFVIYSEMLKPFVKNNEELFSIIIYKNIYPEDFTKLNNKEGNLYNLIKNKPQYIEQLIQEIDIKIIEKKAKVEEIEEDPKETVKELQASYIMKIIDKLADGEWIDKNDLTKEFSEIIEGNTIRVKNAYGNVRSNEYDFSDIEKEVNPCQTYVERAKLIELRQDNKIKSIKSEVLDLQSRKYEIQNWDLKQVFNQIDINPYLHKSLNNGLFRNLILNGYLNENYYDYITLFHEGGSLTKNDLIFDKNVRGGYITKFEHELAEIEILVNGIDDKYFHRDVILNFSLLDYLGENYDDYSSKYDSIIKLLSKEKERSINFIDQYINRGDKAIVVFIQKLILNWSEFWFYIYCNSSYTDERKKEYLRLIFLNTANSDIIENQNTVVLNESISETIFFQSIVEEFDKENIKKATELIEKLEIKFSSLISPNNKTKEFFGFVYHNNHYQLNIENVNLVLNEYGENIKKEDVEIRNYTTILNSNLKPLINYVESNINDYVENIFLKLPDNKNEVEINLILLLNNKNLKEELKIRIIKTTDTLINNLNKIKKGKVKEELLKNNKVVSKWDNVVDYYDTDENKLNSSLIEYLNREEVYQKLGKEKMTYKSEEFEYTKFRKTILLCNEIEDDSYITLLNKTPYKWDELPINDLSGEKVQYLVDQALNTTKYNYNQLRDNYEVYHIGLIENDFDKYLNNNFDFETNQNDVILILKSTKISDEEKLQYAPLIDQQIISESKVTCEMISKLIVNNGAKIDLEYLVFESIISNTTSIEYNVKVINLNYGQFDKSQLRSLINIISIDYSKVFVKRKHSIFDNTDYNKELFEYLDKDNLISSIKSMKENKLRVIGSYD